MKTVDSIKYVACLMAFSCGITQAGTINVPADQPTIQAGIDAAVSGVDEVVVAPGSYLETINFNGKAITVRSTGNGSTSINVQFQEFHAVKCVSGESADTILQGFSIINGDATGAFPDDRGGGMYCKDSSPTIIDCRFHGDANLGGGMYNENSSPTVIGCYFYGNTSSFPGGDATYGGGMYNLNSSPIITGCIFTENSSDADGGGIYNNASSPIITDCIFIDHISNSGSCVYNYNGSNPVITNSIFSSNIANFNGGAMVNNVNCNPTIVNCTFSNNTSMAAD